MLLGNQDKQHHIMSILHADKRELGHTAPPVLPDVNREPGHTAPPTVANVAREPVVLLEKGPETHCTTYPS